MENVSLAVVINNASSDRTIEKTGALVVEEPVRGLQYSDDGKLDPKCFAELIMDVMCGCCAFFRRVLKGNAT
ncbi:hypothetical protein [Methanopyrus sp.]